jgi:chromosomal replication initiator protein
MLEHRTQHQSERLATDQRVVAEPRLRDHDKICDREPHAFLPKYFSNESLHPISLGRMTETLADRTAEPGLVGTRTCACEHDQTVTRHARRMRLYEQELASLEQPCRLRKRCGGCSLQEKALLLVDRGNKLSTAPSTTPRKHFCTITGAHALAKAMFSFAPQIGRLEGSFHRLLRNRRLILMDDPGLSSEDAHVHGVAEGSDRDQPTLPSCSGQTERSRFRPRCSTNQLAASAVGPLETFILMEQLQETRWQQLREALRNRLSPQAFATWVAQMHPVPSDGDNITVGLPDLFSLDWVSNHYFDVFQEELDQIAPGCRLQLKLSENDNDAGQKPQPDPGPPPGPAGPNVPSSRPTKQPRAPSGIVRGQVSFRHRFQDFVTGPSNQLASAAAQTVAENPGGAYNPLFIFGRVGLGKTHLVQSIGHHIQQRRPGVRIQYQTTEQFVNDVIQGIRYERMEEIRERYRACDVLLIDDIQFIAGKEACQAEFFHTFNALHDARKQVAITSDKLPHEIRDLEERVRTRFQWGLIVDLQPPELETRVAIVKKKAESERLDVNDDVAMFIAQSVRSNVRELEGCLIRVSAYASLTNRPITLALAEEVLKDILVDKRQTLTCERIVKTVAQHFQIRVTELKSTKRGRAIAMPRQIAMYLCRKLTDASYPEIGQALGGKDHSTAINAFHRITERIESSKDIRAHVEDIENLLVT